MSQKLTDIQFFALAEVSQELENLKGLMLHAEKRQNVVLALIADSVNISIQNIKIDMNTRLIHTTETQI